MLPVLTVASLSALAATAVTGVFTQNAARTVATAKMTSVATSQQALAHAKALAAAASPVTGRVGNKVATPGWASVKQGVVLKAGLASVDTPSAQPLHILVDLKLRDNQGLETYIRNAHTPGNKAYGTVLTSQQFNDTYAPTTASAQAVSDYLSAQGFRNISIAGNRALVSADGTAGQVAAAFNTHLANITWQGVVRHVNTTDIQVPASLSGLVQTVFGVNDVPIMHLHESAFLASTRAKVGNNAVAGGLATPQTGPAVAHNFGFTGKQLATAYNANAITPAYATTVAIVTGGDDLRAVVPQLLLAERVNKLPVVPVRVFNTVPTPVTTPNADDDGEWDLDAQSSTGIAENVKQLIFYNGTDIGDAAAINQFSVENTAQVGNMSFGGCELAIDTSDLGGYEQMFRQAVAQGQTWFASTGDSGAYCSVGLPNGEDAGIPNIEYPAASPYVVGVGGLTLTTDANFNYVSEAVWYAGGGGSSKYFAPPQWQVDSGAVPTAVAGSGAVGGPTSTASGTVLAPFSVSGTNETGQGRGLPDISMDADSATGYIIYDDGTAEAIGGTSLSSPLAAGSYARMQSAHCNTLGFAAPLIYKLDVAHGPLSTAKGFHDTTSGNNGLYPATTGWDYASGFGSWDIGVVSGLFGTATGCKINQRPVAKIAASTGAGVSPLSVIYSGTGASDPDGDAIVQYTLDYGDGSDLVSQSTPVFAAHTYTSAGTYTATMTVRDAAGSASLPVSTTVTAYGVPAVCTAPGPLVLTSPAGVVGTPVGTVQGATGVDASMGQADVLAGYIAEPADLVNKLVFTLKVDNLKGGPMMGYRWMFFFTIPEDSNNYFVAMDTGSSSTPVFNYGIRSASEQPNVPVLVQTFSVLGTLDASSKYDPDGTITLVLDKSKLGPTGLKNGDALSFIEGETRTTGPDAAGGVGLTEDVGGASYPYILVGNDVCKADIANPNGPTTTPTTGSTTKPTTGGTPAPTTSGGGTTSPTTGGSGNGGMGSPTTGGSGGGTTSPTTGGSGGTTSPTTGGSGVGITTVTTGGGSREVEAGRGGTGSGAMGWLVLLPLSVGALRRRKGAGRRARE